MNSPYKNVHLLDIKWTISNKEEHEQYIPKLNKFIIEHVEKIIYI